MNDCVNAEFRDALPDLLHGRLNALDRATLTAHVESCADCRAELALLGEARASAPVPPSIDVASVAAKIRPYAPRQVSPVSSGSRRPRFERLQLSWRVAAALALVAAGGLTLSDVYRRNASSRVTVRAAADGPGAVADRATNVPASQPAGSGPSAVSGVARPSAGRGPTSSPTNVRQVAALSLVTGVAELGDAELETLLTELDDFETLPSAEPHTLTLSVEDIESDQ